MKSVSEPAASHCEEMSSQLGKQEGAAHDVWLPHQENPYHPITHHL
jgi:hypothetical protein